MLGFNDYHDAQRVECLLDALLNLKCHPFLHLQTVGEDIDYSGYLAEACDVAIGDVGYMSFAVEGEHVVLAKGKEVDVFYNNHLAIFLFEFGRLQHFVGVHGIAFGKLQHRFGYPFGGF